MWRLDWPLLHIPVTVSSGQHGIEVLIELNGHSVLIELDTGAGVSIISEDTYRKFFKNVSLKPSTTKWHAYVGDPIQVRGQFTSMYVSHTSPILQPFPSQWVGAQDHPSWGEIGSLKSTLIGKESSVSMLLRIQFRLKSISSCTPPSKVIQIFSRMNLAQ